jgi:hypothetical protein
MQGRMMALYNKLHSTLSHVLKTTPANFSRNMKEIKSAMPEKKANLHQVRKSCIIYTDRSHLAVKLRQN